MKTFCKYSLPEGRVISPLLFILTLALTACIDDTAQLTKIGTPLQLNVQTAAIQSRRLIESATLPDGHSIGLTLVDVSDATYNKITYHNIKATASTGKVSQTWTLASDILLSATNGTLYGYYPWSDKVTDITQIPVAANDTDYMYATPVTEVNDGKASPTVVMNHALAAIRLNIIRGTYTGIGQVTAVSVKGDNIATSGTLNVKTGTLSSQTGMGTPVTNTAAFTISTNSTQVDLITVPVTSSAAAPTLTVTMDGADYTVTPEAVTLAQGSVYEYTLTVDAAGMTINNIKVGDWEFSNSSNLIIDAGYKITLTGDVAGLTFNYTINDDGSVTIIANPVDRELMVGDITYNKTADVSQTLDEYGVRFITLTNITGDVTLTFNGVKSNAIDLSKQDIYGNQTAQTTANCYVVSKPGTYKFPLVFGNAIVNGETNTVSYTKVAGSYSHDFVDYKGTVITSPYIESLSGKAVSAQLSIADTDQIFTDIAIVEDTECNYVQFKVPIIPHTGANGIISIKDASGTIMWNWHIWVWEDDLTPVEITNATGYKYNILPVNLASKWDKNTKEHIKNWFYQWGRPTPLLCPSSYNSPDTHDSYGHLTYSKTNKAANFHDGIQNPTKFYYNGTSPYNWFGNSSYYNLWNADCIATGNSDIDVKKTVYDPCPPGFKIPNGNTFSYFSRTNIVGNYDYGYKFKRNKDDTEGVFFPVSGCRVGEDGGLDNVGGWGMVWLSSAYDQSKAYEFSFSSNYVYQQSDCRRTYALSVRPVQDKH